MLHGTLAGEIQPSQDVLHGSPLILKSPLVGVSKDKARGWGLMVLAAMRSIVRRRRPSLIAPFATASLPHGLLGRWRLLTTRIRLAQRNEFERFPIALDVAGIVVPADHKHRPVGKAREQLAPRHHGLFGIGIRS